MSAVTAMPRPRLIRWIMLVIGVLGIALTIYLTIVHYQNLKPVCSLGKACIKVQTSKWSRVDGVPVALIGLIGWIGIMIAMVAPEREETRLAVLAMTLIGVGFSAYLTYREIWSIHAVCEECATNAVLMVLMLIGAGYRYLAGDQTPPPAPPATLSRGRPDAASGPGELTGPGGSG